MAISGLSIIGEAINDSVPSTRALYDAEDLDGVVALAKMQDEGGAAYIDVNVGGRSPEFMAEMVRNVQRVTGKPLSIDTPDLAIAEAGLKAYDAERAGGRRPLLNSISPLRLGMLDLFKIQPFMPILMISERVVDGQSVPVRTGEEGHLAAQEMMAAVRKSGHAIANSEVIFDPGIPPIGGDIEGLTKMVIDGLGRIHADPELAGVHASVGLSNFTVMLPAKRPDGSPVRSTLESAFLTKAMPRGLDMVIGSVKRKYALLEADHPAMQCLEDVLARDGYDCVMRVAEFCSM